MKTLSLFATIAIAGALTVATANEQVQVPQTVDAQIAAIQQADPQERVELMNRFKEQLMQLNEEQRAEAIAKMQAQMQRHQGEQGSMHSAEAMQHKDRMRQNAQEHMQEMQMHANEETHSMQHMNQQQMGSQFGHEMEHSGGGVRPPMEGGSGSHQEFEMGMQPKMGEH